ncbi:Swarming motility protein YbiA [Gimesia panareensis]|uniref:Swarming motility protein YbiA n=1 Tax=Gimesia panareensis TaxID=2527978 RepID=A0A518FIU1_9PLAN|nr:NADAR family protein [Gimesia panareensis]QDV16264.1 Swarming motility protein YbiA [Gimesia panareensis]
MTIYFYTRNDEHGAFSNFSPHGVEMDGLWWPSVEHYFQAQKFSDPEYRERIRAAHDSKQAALLGRSRKVKLREDWETVKEEIMSEAVLKKFQTHLELKALLLSTGNESIVENAPGDYFWGCGQDGTGLNRLGVILECVRAELRQAIVEDQL